MITYYKSQEEIARALKMLIDEYWALSIEEDVFISTLRNIVQNNQEKIFKEQAFTTLLQQRLGKKRLNLIKKVMEEDAE